MVRSRACSSARLERTPDKREVGSSSLPRPTILIKYWGRSSVGRAVALQASGRRFDPVRLHHFKDGVNGSYEGQISGKVFQIKRLRLICMLFVIVNRSIIITSN